MRKLQDVTPVVMIYKPLFSKKAPSRDSPCGLDEVSSHVEKAHVARNYR